MRFRSRRVTTRRIKDPPPPSAAWRRGSATNNRLHLDGTQVAVKVENFTSVYQSKRSEDPGPEPQKRPADKSHSTFSCFQTIFRRGKQTSGGRLR